MRDKPFLKSERSPAGARKSERNWEVLLFVIRPKAFENHFNEAIDYGITSFPDEVSGASQEA